MRNRIQLYGAAFVIFVISTTAFAQSQNAIRQQGDRVVVGTNLVTINVIVRGCAVFITHRTVYRLTTGGLALVLSLVLPTASPLSSNNRYIAPQTPGHPGSWLDRPIGNWNEKSKQLPTPITPVNDEEIKTRCPDLLRQVDTPYDREIVEAGWLLYGSVQSYGITKVVMAMSAADDSCHPVGYQALVYIGSNYAGTLSPESMQWSTSGALTNIRLLGPYRIAAEFARYREDDAACCPTRVSYVTYEASEGDNPIIRPIEIVTKTLCPNATEVRADDNARLFEVKWRLTQIGAVALPSTAPYIRFERRAKIFSGNGGCNQIAGAFELDGTSISLRQNVRTNFACLDAEAQQLEMDLLKALQQTTRFELQGDVLQLYDCGNLLLVFHSDTSHR